MQKVDWKTAEKILLDGGVGILPTDTIYGFSALARNKEAILRIYTTKQRPHHKALVVLAASQQQIQEYWPSAKVFELAVSKKPTTFIYPLESMTTIYPKPIDSLAIRIPTNKPRLMELLLQTGPIVSTSVNKAAMKPISEPNKIEEVFGAEIDFLVDEGYLAGSSSQIIKIHDNGNQEVLR